MTGRWERGHRMNPGSLGWGSHESGDRLWVGYGPTSSSQVTAPFPVHIHMSTTPCLHPTQDDTAHPDRKERLDAVSQRSKVPCQFLSLAPINYFPLHCHQHCKELQIKALPISKVERDSKLGDWGAMEAVTWPCPARSGQLAPPEGGSPLFQRILRPQLYSNVSPLPKNICMPQVVQRLGFSHKQTKGMFA